MKRGLKWSGLAMMALALVAAGNKPAETAPAGSAVISGKVTLTGTAPTPRRIQMTADPVCLQQHPNPVMAQDVVANNGMLQWVLVYVKDGLTGSFPPPAQPVVINQTGCMYDPHVFGIQVGQKLEIVNNDSTLHNINCQAKINKRFNIAQPVKGMKSVKTFDQPELGIPFKCNVHPWMSAHAGVFSHPFFAVTGADGSFTLKGLPAGTYTIEAWQEKLGTRSQKVTVANGESKELNFSFSGK